MAATTRERILEVSLQLFLARGYDATSLREISDQLGFTKAALYYHFKSKDDILRALLEPFDAFLSEMADSLAEAEGLVGWRDALVALIDRTTPFYDVLALVQRNYGAVSALEPIETRRIDQLAHDIEAAVFSISDDVGERVRMLAALATITRFDEWAHTLIDSTPSDDLAAHLTSIVDDILGLSSN